MKKSYYNEEYIAFTFKPAEQRRFLSCAGNPGLQSSDLPLEKQVRWNAVERYEAMKQPKSRALPIRLQDIILCFFLIVKRSGTYLFSNSNLISRLNSYCNTIFSCQYVKYVLRIYLTPYRFRIKNKPGDFIARFILSCLLRFLYFDEHAILFHSAREIVHAPESFINQDKQTHLAVANRAPED